MNTVTKIETTKLNISQAINQYLQSKLIIKNYLNENDGDVEELLRFGKSFNALAKLITDYQISLPAKNIREPLDKKHPKYGFFLRWYGVQANDGADGTYTVQARPENRDKKLMACDRIRRNEWKANGFSLQKFKNEKSVKKQLAKKQPAKPVVLDDLVVPEGFQITSLVEV